MAAASTRTGVGVERHAVDALGSTHRHQAGGDVAVHRIGVAVDRVAVAATALEPVVETVADAELHVAPLDRCSTDSPVVDARSGHVVEVRSRKIELPVRHPGRPPEIPMLSGEVRPFVITMRVMPSSADSWGVDANSWVTPPRYLPGPPLSVTARR